MVITLVKVPEDVRKTFEKSRVIPMATADLTGKPNVILVGMWWWEDEETLVVVNNYLNKTLKNLKANPRVAFVGRDGENRKCFQIKCSADIQDEGPLYEKGREMATGRERAMPGKAVVVLKVDEIYQAQGGQGSGDRIL